MRKLKYLLLGVAGLDLTAILVLVSRDLTHPTLALVIAAGALAIVCITEALRDVR